MLTITVCLAALFLPLIPADCPWRICHTVEVHNVPRLAADGSSVGYRMLSAQQCQPGNNFPERCHVHETAHRPDRVLNFTMRQAQLEVAPLAGLCQFTELAGLDLAENAIADFAYPADALAAWPGCLGRLRWLSLRANRLRSVDIAQFLRLPGLEQLDLTDNRQLESLYLGQAPPPASSEPPVALKTILASRCGIKQVDISLVRLTSLQDIDLSYNRVSRVTNRLNWTWTTGEVASIAAVRNAKRARDPHYYARLSVQLVQNQIGAEAFADGRTLWGLPVPSLTSESADSADAVVNALKLYRDAFQSFLYIDNTDSTVNCDCRLLPAWAFLRRVHRDPDEFSRRNALSLAYWLRLRCDPASLSQGGGGGGGGGLLSRRNLTSLADTDLACRHSADCPTGCSCLERVMPSELTLDCRGAGLSALPSRLPASVHSVRYNLLLADNRIGSLDALPAPANASLVQRIDLSRNRISAATNFAPLSAFTGLHWLNLSGNPLLSLPPSLLRLAATGQRSAAPRIDLGGSAAFHCYCAQLEPDAWENLRRLLGDGIRTLRCFGASGEPETPAEFRHRQCVQPPNATTSVVVKEQQTVDQSVVLWAGVASVFAFLLAMITAVVVLLRHRCGQIRRDKAPPPQQPPPPSQVPHAPLLQQPAVAVPPFVQGSCVSPDYLPLSCSPFEQQPLHPPRYAQAPHAPALLVLTSVDDAYRGGGAGFRGGSLGRRYRTELVLDSHRGGGPYSDDFSSSDDDDDDDDDAPPDVVGDPAFGAAGGSDPTMPGSRYGWQGSAGRGNRLCNSREDQRRRREHSRRQMRENEILLPPPLPPRTQPALNGQLFGSPSGTVALATDV